MVESMSIAITHTIKIYMVRESTAPNGLYGLYFYFGYQIARGVDMKSYITRMISVSRIQINCGVAYSITTEKVL